MHNQELTANKQIIKTAIREIAQVIDRKTILGSVHFNYLKRVERKALRVPSSANVKRIKSLTKRSKRRLRPLYLATFADELDTPKIFKNNEL